MNQPPDNNVQLRLFAVPTKTAFHFLESEISHILRRRKPWSSGRALGSRSEGHWFNPRPLLDGSGVKAMPGSIPTPSSGSL